MSRREIEIIDYEMDSAPGSAVDDIANYVNAKYDMSMTVEQIYDYIKMNRV